MPVRFAQLFNVTPNNSDNGSYIAYNHAERRFEFRNVTADTVLEEAAQDQSLPEEFTNQITDGLDAENIVLVKIDGGSF